MSLLSGGARAGRRGATSSTDIHHRVAYEPASPPSWCGSPTHSSPRDGPEFPSEPARGVVIGLSATVSPLSGGARRRPAIVATSSTDIHHRVAYEQATRRHTPHPAMAGAPRRRGRGLSTVRPLPPHREPDRPLDRPPGSARSRPVPEPLGRHQLRSTPGTVERLGGEERHLAVAPVVDDQRPSGEPSARAAVRSIVGRRALSSSARQMRAAHRRPHRRTEPEHLLEALEVRLDRGGPGDQHRPRQRSAPSPRRAPWPAHRRSGQSPPRCDGSRRSTASTASTACGRGPRRPDDRPCAGKVDGHHPPSRVPQRLDEAGQVSRAPFHPCTRTTVGPPPCPHVARHPVPPDRRSCSTRRAPG